MGALMNDFLKRVMSQRQEEQMLYERGPEKSPNCRECGREMKRQNTYGICFKCRKPEYDRQKKTRTLHNHTQDMRGLSPC
jgi:hypothetical protein